MTSPGLFVSCLSAAALSWFAIDASAQSAPVGGPAAGPALIDVDPLPRVREGGAPPDDPNQSLRPAAMTWNATSDKGLSGPPTNGVIASQPEYGPSDGVLFSYGQGWSDTVTDCVAALTGDPTKSDIAYVVVETTAAMNNAISAFTSAGADLNKVEFFIEPMNAVWLRDYGPHFIWQRGAKAIVDSHYYSSRPLDNFVPTLLADEFELPAYPMGLYYSGGNFQPGPDRSGFVTSLVQQDNPGFSDEYLLELYHRYQGIDTLHIMPRLPSTVDGTGHIDMWFYLVDEDTVIISEFLPGSNATAISVTNNAVVYMQNLGFQVHRVPAWNSGGVHYTYTNAYRVNDRIFTPAYRFGNPSYQSSDQAALLAWQTAAGPGVEIIEIDCYSIIPASGAIHCIVKQVPAYVDSIPSVAVVSPDGGELLVAGESVDLRWTATDDVDITSVDLTYSVDGGTTFPHVIATGEANDGQFGWTVPATLTTQAVVKVEAHDGAANSVAANSETPIEISGAPQSVYDFSVNAGIDRWGFGNYTLSWTSLEGVRYPATASTQLAAANYLAMANSDATGGDTDTNRYRSPTPSSGRESTHIFEFTVAEDPSTILDLGLLWEGYGDTCLQMELYVWDNVAGNWGDGRGAVGENRYMANYAGNRDEELVGHVRTGFDRYIDPSGKLTLLLYAERPSQESFHDYLAVTVTHTGGALNPWVDLGHGLAGSFGMPHLVGNGPLLGGQPINLILTQTLEDAPAFMVIGLSGVYAPIRGGVLVPSTDAILPFPTGATGNVGLSVTWPSSIGSGISFYVQSWIMDDGGPLGVAASNGVVATTP